MGEADLAENILRGRSGGGAAPLVFCAAGHLLCCAGAIGTSGVQIFSRMRGFSS